MIQIGITVFLVAACVMLLYGVILAARGILIFTLQSFFHKPLKTTIVVLLVSSAIASPFIYNHIEKKWLAEREKGRKENRDTKYAAFAQSKEGLMACVKSFNSQFFLAPAWKKNLPKGTSIEIDVYKQGGDTGTAYVFMVSDILKKQPSFWVDADVPHFMRWDDPYFSIDEVHFQKNQYFDVRYRFNSVVCSPISSGYGTISSEEMYYVIFDGSFTAKDYRRHFEKIRASGFMDLKGGLKFSIKNLGKGERFYESNLNPSSKEVEKVHSIKL